MTEDQYVEAVLRKYEVPRGATSGAERLGTTVAGPIRAWAGGQLNGLDYSGSYAKETAVHGVSDVDIFISLKADTKNTLKEIYDGLYSLAQKSGWSPRLQNVSVGVTIGETRGDLVPGKVLSGYKNYHSLYLRKTDSRRQTNVALHFQTVHDSGRLREIRAIKIWRLHNNLEWPSLYLELFTIQALSGRPRTALADNVLHVLRSAGTSLALTRIEDPANTNNVLSDDLSGPEKQQIADLALRSAQEPSWGSIIW